METIVKAKDHQAAEANKNASILLKELDLEKVGPNWCPGLFKRMFPPGPGAHRLLLFTLTVQRGEQEASSGRQAGEAQGEAQEEEGAAAEEEAGGGGGAEDEGGILRDAGSQGGLC